MKTILIVLGILLSASCSENKTQTNQKSKNSDLISDSNYEFKAYFDNLDSTQAITSIGCIGGYYMQLNNKYVLKISLNIDFKHGEVKKVQIDSNSYNVNIELLEFEEGGASLSNFCTDIHITNIPHPIAKHTTGKGFLVIGKSDPTDYYGNKTPRISIHIDQLTIYDSLGAEKLDIENKLMWKVLNQGTPG